MECTFKPGDKVVCVDDAPKSHNLFGQPLDPNMDGLKRGLSYTVRGVFVSQYPEHGGECQIALHEIFRPDLGSGELGFDHKRFRPVEYQTDISSLRAHLTAPHKQAEDA